MNLVPRRGLLRLGAAVVVAVAMATLTTAAGSATAAATAAAAAPAAAPEQSSTTVGQWSAPFDLGLVAAHATLLPTGKVLLFADPDTHLGSEAHIWDPANMSNVDIGLSGARNLFCAGQTVLADGRVLVAGGTRFGSPRDGTKLTTLLDPGTNQWIPGPLMQRRRWYPSLLELGDGRSLVFGGWADSKHPLESVEMLNRAATKFSLLPQSADRELGLYPGMHLLPNGNVFFSSEEDAGFVEQPAVFNPATNAWHSVARMLDGPRWQTPSVLLPGLHEVLVPGGTSSLKDNFGGAKSSAEIFDFGAASPGWRLTGSMAFARRNDNAVLLADGTVLAVGGNQTGFYGNPVFEAELFDPATDAWTTMAAQQAPRGHHSIALLLPDGRVLSAGQTDGDQGNTGEIYSPPYLFKGTRPVIDSVASSVGYGDPLPISTPDAASIERVALVRPGSVTHMANFDQRYVDLAYSTRDSVVRATSPADGNIAPPGWYMLFVVNAQGVPSVASWVHVG